ncbi:MAG: hypothetical protein KF802_02220 [Bdellovibrionaceae bacterium]|nr:hypothetical protein [Pseudobdellovibrionaceae bacterium]
MDVKPESLSEEEIRRLVAGLRITDALNFSLFNAPPKKQKAWWIYKDLLENGYGEKDFNVAYDKIRDFFEQRTRRNQSKLFTHFFNLPATYDNIYLFNLDYRNVDMSDTRIQKISDYIFSEFRKVQDPTPLGLTPYVVFYALKKLYSPRWDEDARGFDVIDLRYKVSEHLRYSGSSEDVFLDPILDYITSFNPKGKEHLIGQIQTAEKKKSQDGSLGVTEDKEVGINNDKVGFQDRQTLSEHLTHKVSSLTIALNYGEFEWCKEIELAFIKNEFPKELPDLKVKNPGRVPEVLKLWNGTRRYNLLIQNCHGIMNAEQLEILTKLRQAIVQQATKLLSIYRKKESA